VSDKDNVMELPEGKTSEEIDAIMMEDEEPLEVDEIDDPNLAEEALKATETPVDKPADDEVSVVEKVAEEVVLSETDQQLRAKDAKIASMKHTNRELEIDRAKMQGRLEVMEEMGSAAKEVQKSPLEIAMEAEGIDDPDDLEKPYSVMVAQQKWEKEQEQISASKVKQVNDNTVSSQLQNELQDGELSEKQMGQGLDLKTVSGIGIQYLTEGDKLNIKRTVERRGNKAALMEAYTTMVQRTIAAGNEDSKLLQNAINVKGKTVTKKTLKTETNIDDLTTEGEKSGIEQETVSKKLEGFVGKGFFK